MPWNVYSSLYLFVCLFITPLHTACHWIATGPLYLLSETLPLWKNNDHQYTYQHSEHNIVLYNYCQKFFFLMNKPFYYLHCVTSWYEMRCMIKLWLDLIWEVCQFPPGNNMSLEWSNLKGAALLGQFTPGNRMRLHMCPWRLVIRPHLPALCANRHVHRSRLPRPNAQGGSLLSPPPHSRFPLTSFQNKTQTIILMIWKIYPVFVFLSGELIFWARTLKRQPQKGYTMQQSVSK